MKYLRRCRSRSRAGSTSSRRLMKPGAGPCPSRVTTPGTSSSPRASRSRRRLQQPDHRGLALPLEHAVDRPSGVLEQLARHERCAVAADEDEHVRADRPGRPGQLDHLGHVRQVVVRDGDRIGRPFPDDSKIARLATPPGGRSAEPHAPPVALRPRSARSPAAPAAGRSWYTSGDSDGRPGVSWVGHRPGCGKGIFTTSGTACITKSDRRPEGLPTFAGLSTDTRVAAQPEQPQDHPILRDFTRILGRHETRGCSSGDEREPVSSSSAWTDGPPRRPGRRTGRSCRGTGRPVCGRSGHTPGGRARYCAGSPSGRACRGSRSARGDRRSGSSRVGATWSEPSWIASMMARVWASLIREPTP